jgi:glycosyltransferase involved in cell wall biosynthesis
MHTVFVHDHKFRRVDNRIYSPGGLSYEILSRYVNWFGDITVIGRVINENNAKSNYSEIVGTNIHVEEADDLSLRIKEADAVIVRLPSINGYRAVYYARKYKKPYLVEVVGCTWDAYWNYGLKGKVFALPAYFVMRQAIKNAPYAVYVTSQFLQKRYPCRGKTVAVSDVALETNQDSVLEARLLKIYAEKDKIILGTAAAVDVPYKGQEFVIRSLKRLEKNLGKRLEYQLAGAGDPSRLRQVAKECNVEDRLVLMGTVPHGKIYGWLDSLDIYVQPSLLEGLSRALVEAMSRGLPCIATNCGGNFELLDSSCVVRNGGKRKFSDAIADHLERLFVDDNLLKQAKRNYEVATTQYDKDSLEAKRTAFYEGFKRQNLEMK